MRLRTAISFRHHKYTNILLICKGFALFRWSINYEDFSRIYCQNALFEVILQIKLKIILIMKKILFVLPILIALFICNGCSSDDEPQEPVNITLSKTEISISVDDEANIEVAGIDINKCTVQSDDEFIAKAMIYDGKINIEAEHVGETLITVQYRDTKLTCKVSVTSLINFIGNPILDFGDSKANIKAKLKGEIIDETEKRIEIKEDFKYPIYDTYHFNNGVLECVYSGVNVKTSTVDILNSLLERYKHVSSESNVHWFSYPNKFIIRENVRGGNGGYVIRYAKDKETMAKYYDIN